LLAISSSPGRSLKSTLTWALWRKLLLDMFSPRVSRASPPPVLSPDCVTFSSHAVDRMLDMNVEGLEIQSALFDPAIVHFSVKHSSWNFISGRVCCGVYVDSKG